MHPPYLFVLPSFICYFLLFETGNRSTCEHVHSVISFRVEFYNSSRGVVFHPPTTRLMQSYSQDEMLTVSTTTRRAFSVIKFPFDANRLVLLHQFFLSTLYRVFRYQWNTHGIVSFLDNRDRYSIALANFAAWDEYAERITDELAHSPVAGALDSAVVTPQLAPVDAYP